MINRDNYFQNTKAIFKYKDSFINDDFFEWTKYGYKTAPQYRIKQIVKESLSLGENDKKLIRINNHWSNSNLNNINKCRWIRSCFWELKGNKVKNKDTKQLQMGIVDFAKMQGVLNETML